MKIVFMGTPDFAVETLRGIAKAGHEILGVVTQPDKPKGRGKALQPTPVKAAAKGLGLPVYQPENVKDPKFVEMLKGLNPDVIVVVAFGQLVSKEILEIPPYGCLNVHASLLPSYRGAAPIQWAVIRGEKESGVTIMRMDEGLDTGDMLAKKTVRLETGETGGSLFDRLSVLGAGLLVETLEKAAAGTVTAVPQSAESPTPYASMIKKSMGCIEWEQKAGQIERLTRGLDPWPSAFTRLNGKTLKIFKSCVCDPPDMGCLDGEDIRPGQVLETDKAGIYVKCGQGCLRIEELQLEGKKRMAAADFLRGCQITEGTVLS